ncbi:MAG: FkbM family methyltransferase [Acidobacteriota bacterium]
MAQAANICAHHVFLDLVDPEASVLDLGAYEGGFARELSERTGARVIAVEANPQMFEQLYSSERVTKLHLAVADQEGTIRLHLGDNPLGNSVFASHPNSDGEQVEVPALTLEQVIARHCGGRVDLLKVNIEGAEIPMLEATSDATLQAIRQITIQFHDFLPELDQKEDVVRAKTRLKDLGFGEILFKTPNKDVVFLNLRAGAISPARFRVERLRVRVKQYLRAAQKKLGLG